jgi:hypothetical protein
VSRQVLRRRRTAEAPATGAAVLALATLFLAALLTVRDTQQVWRFPGLTAAQGAFAIHRPYEAYIALGHLVPGAEYLLIGDPEAQSSTWGGSRLWHEEQLIGSARASGVIWLPQVPGPLQHDVVPIAARVWSGYNTLLGSIEVLVVDPSATVLVVHHVTDGDAADAAGLTRIVDIRLLDAVSRAAVEAAVEAQRG